MRFRKWIRFLLNNLVCNQNNSKWKIRACFIYIFYFKKNVTFMTSVSKTLRKEITYYELHIGLLPGHIHRRMNLN